MQDPNPENIVGQKRVTHSVEWQINVGYALLGVLGLYLAWKVFGGLSSSSEDEQSDPDAVDELTDAAEVIEVM